MSRWMATLRVVVKLAAAQKEVEGHLAASKAQIDSKMQELSSEVKDSMEALVELAKQDEQMADILKQLEGQSTTVSWTNEQTNETNKLEFS